jgi:CheY-like chemotaxis protein
MKEEILHRHPIVFIADDDDDDLYFVRKAVEELNAGIELKHFSNGVQLLQGLKDSVKSLPNFVLLDLNMPILDGRETLRMIRKNSGFNDLPVIIFSTSNHDHERDICFEYGASSYFSKPCNYPNYLEIMRKLKVRWIDKVEA